MKRLFLSAAAIALGISAAHATDRQLDTLNFTGETANVRGQKNLDVVEVVGIFWDDRCADPEWVMNVQPANSADVFGVPSIEIQPERLVEIVNDGLNRWNDNPSSFIEMQVTEIRDVRGDGGLSPRVGGDFINEVTFFTAPGFGALASSPSTSLEEDATFAVGDDLDGDGDSDVFDPAVEGVNKCFDADGDGDIEFPAGDYKAGTILDNDVQFGREVLWEDGPGTFPFAGINAADIDGVSTHEFGHSHSLNHSSIDQISSTNGDGSTMFPFIDTSDNATEFSARTPYLDDLIASARVYPEGKGGRLGSIDPGDVAFADAFEVIKGELLLDDKGVLGGNVQAINVATGEVVAESYAGRSTVFTDVPVPLFLSDFQVFNRSIDDGKFEIPVPKGGAYALRIQALDGDPAATGNISLNAIFGGTLGLANFPEEFLGAPNQEDNFETAPGENISVVPEPIDLAALAGLPQGDLNGGGVDLTIVTNDEKSLFAHGPLFFIGSTRAVTVATDLAYAKRFDRDLVLDAIADNETPVSGTFRTTTTNASQVPIFESAQLALGVANPDGTATIGEILREELNFVGQPGDSTPFFFDNADSLENEIVAKLNANPGSDLFLVLNGDPNAPVGQDGRNSMWLGFDNDGVDEGDSYISFDGEPLTNVTQQFGGFPLDLIVELNFASRN